MYPRHDYDDQATAHQVWVQYIYHRDMQNAEIRRWVGRNNILRDQKKDLISQVGELQKRIEELEKEIA